MRVGIAGLGFMGMIHYLTYQKLPGAKVVAIAEPLEHRRRGDWTDIQGNFGPAGKQTDLAGVTTYGTAEEMIASEDLDLVDVCLPPGFHAAVSALASSAARNVFCEKPIALSVTDADKMVAAAAAANRQLMIGHVLPYFPEYAFVLQAAQEGTYGDLLGGHFQRVISDPSWLNNFWESEKIGGPMLDLHIHDAHFIRLMFGMPSGVHTTGRMRNGLAEHWNTQFRFTDSPLAVTATSGVINQQGRPFLHGYEVHFADATVVFTFAVIDGEGQTLQPLTVLKKDGSVQQPQLSDGDPMFAFASELGEVQRAITSGSPSQTLDASLALDALKLCQQQTKSLVETCGR